MRVYKTPLKLNVATEVIFVKDGAAYYDSECTIPVLKKDAVILFLNGVTATKDDKYYKSTSCSDSAITFDTIGEVTCSDPVVVEPPVVEENHREPETAPEEVTED